MDRLRAVYNVHERKVAGAGALVDSLSGPEDRLWPQAWPTMTFDRSLGVGASGGHGPIHCVVEHYVPGQWSAVPLYGAAGVP